ncbi:MAG: hypothetical protein KatS3mg129_2918 [Leptospiraceae bacterium]|nr:MAG: hypothetical protein KatS3mg129_2918 [Leptospiraceae bacterium]
MKLKTFLLFVILFFNLFYQNLYSNQPEQYKLPANTLTIAFGGDTHFLWGVMELQNKEGLLAPVEQLQTFFQRFDFRILNIETVISYNGKSKNQKNYVFRSDPENIKLLKTLNINLAILGNNHSYDLKEEGLKEMLDWFKKNEIPTIGAGLNLEEAIEPYQIELNGIKFAFFSICMICSKEDYANKKQPGVAGYNKYLLQKITQVKKNVDYIFLSIHWGKEYNPFIEKWQKDLTHQLFKKDVHFIIGHHPHIPQSIEVYKNNAVIYSLGNFLFGSANYLQDENIIAVFHFDKKEKRFLGIEVFPITGKYRKYGYKLREPENTDKIKLFKELYYLSKKENPDQLIFISDNQKSLFFKALD